MSGIFISYRRSDAVGWAGRLYDSLKHLLTHAPIFMDVEAIPPGVKFPTYIHEAVGSCDVLILLIGPGWIASKDLAGARRLDDPDDFVSLELMAALERDVLVIPVLVGDATMPAKSDLPERLRPLCDRQNFVIGDRSWQDDCARLAGHVQRVIAPGPSRGRRMALLGGTGATLILIAGLAWWAGQRPNPVASPEPVPGPVAVETKPTPPAFAPQNSRPSPQPRPAPVDASPAPTAPSPAPPVNTLWDLHPEGEWGLVQVSQNGQLVPYTGQPLWAKLTKLDGSKVRVELSEGGQLRDLATLTIAGDSIKAEFAVDGKTEVTAVLRRDRSAGPGRWTVSLAKGAQAEDEFGNGWAKISDDWRNWEGEISTKEGEDKGRLEMTVSPDARTWTGSVRTGRQQPTRADSLRFQKR